VRNGALPGGWSLSARGRVAGWPARNMRDVGLKQQHWLGRGPSWWGQANPNAPSCAIATRRECQENVEFTATVNVNRLTSPKCLQ
jgi:hypothetical protein